jgi:hypothetical protein
MSEYEEYHTVIAKASCGEAQHEALAISASHRKLATTNRKIKSKHVWMFRSILTPLRSRSRPVNGKRETENSERIWVIARII